MSRVIVTGARGFIGRHLVPVLRTAGHEVVDVDVDAGDVQDPATWARLPAAEAVVHLAARTFVPSSWSAPVAFVQCNLLGTMQALDYCRSRGARLVCLSSYLYGTPASLPIPESAPRSANNPYGLSKLLAEEACEFYSRSLGVSAVILRLFNVYGPGQADQFLVPLLISQALGGREIVVKDLAPRRDFVYVADVVAAIVKSLEVPGSFGVYNIGSGRSHSVAEVIDLVQRACGTRLAVRSEQETRPHEIADTVADISRARTSLRWEPRWELAEGIAETVAAWSRARKT